MNQQGKTGLLDCHKALSLRRPEAASWARMTTFNKKNVSIKKNYKKYQFTNNYIFNFDETDCSTVQKLPKVIKKKGAHQVGLVTSRERGKSISMIGIIYANDNSLPLILVFPIVR